jgi:hypothetical protein
LCGSKIQIQINTQCVNFGKTRVFVVISPVRKHSPLALVIIPLLAIVLWIPGFIHPLPPIGKVEMPLYSLADSFFRSHHYVALTIGWLLLLAEAFLLNIILQAHQVIIKKNWLPALFVVVFGSCSPGLLWPGAEQFAGLLLLLVIHILLGTYRQDKSFGSVFNCGLLIGLAAQIYFPSLVFFLFGLIAIIILRPFIWREWVMLILGVLIPFIYGGVYYFWNDEYSEITKRVITDPIVDRSFFLKLDSSDYFLATMTLLVLLVSAGRLVSGSLTSTLKTKKGISVFLWFTFFALVAILPAQNFGVGTFRFVIYPFAFFASNYFLNARRGWLAEVIFTLLLAGIGVSYLIESGFTL